MAGAVFSQVFARRRIERLPGESCADVGANRLKMERKNRLVRNPFDCGANLNEPRFSHLSQQRVEQLSNRELD